MAEQTNIHLENMAKVASRWLPEAVSLIDPVWPSHPPFDADRGAKSAAHHALHELLVGTKTDEDFELVSKTVLLLDALMSRRTNLDALEFCSIVVAFASKGQRDMALDVVEALNRGAKASEFGEWRNALANLSGSALRLC